MQAQPIPKIPSKGVMLEAWQQSLSEARQIAKMVLGRAASTVVAERNSGIQRRRIIGHRATTSSSKSAVINGGNSFMCISSGRKRCPYSRGALSLNTSASRVTRRRPATSFTNCLNATATHQQTVYGVLWTPGGACATSGRALATGYGQRPDLMVALFARVAPKGRLAKVS